MKNKVLISILLIFIMLTVQFCDAGNIIDIIALVLCLIFGGIDDSPQWVKVEPTVDHVRQTGDIYCSAACIEMIGRWTDWNDHQNISYLPMQSDIMNWADDPQNGGDSDNKLSNVEVVNAVKYFAYDTCFSEKFPASSGPVKSVDDALSQAILQAGDSNNVPSIMTVDWNDQLYMGHSVLLQGFCGDNLKDDIANMEKVWLNDPDDTSYRDDYSPTQLRSRMTSFWWNAPGGRYCHGIFLKPVD